MYTSKVIFLQFWQQCLNKTSALHTELQYDSLADSFCFGICNTQWEVSKVKLKLSKQVNYNQVVVICQILQECFLQNFNMQKFHYMEHSNSRTFQGLSRALNFFLQIEGLSRTSQGPYEPWHKQQLLYPCSTDATVNMKYPNPAPTPVFMNIDAIPFKAFIRTRAEPWNCHSGGNEYKFVFDRSQVNKQRAKWNQYNVPVVDFWCKQCAYH